MPTVTLTDPVNLTLTDASIFAANHAAIKAVVNGALADDNVAAGAGLALSKLASYPTDASKFLAGDGTWKSLTQTGLIGARVTHNAAQGTTSGNDLTLAFNTEIFDTDTIHDTVTQNTRLTCKTAGIYFIWANVEFASAAGATTRRAMFKVSGTTWIGSSRVIQGSASDVCSLNPQTIWKLAVNDYVELIVNQNSGVGVNITVNGQLSPIFGMVRIGSGP